MKIVYLYPKSSLVTELRSDTLWGLIAYSMAFLYSKKEVDAFHEGYKNGAPPFLISSVFPFKKRDDQATPILFFPRPVLHGNDFVVPGAWDKKQKLEFLQHLKKFKKIKFMAQEVFEKFLSGELDDKKYFDSKSWLDAVNNKPKHQQELIPHNTISRKTWTTLEINKAGQLFTTEETFFESGSGLFFLARGQQLHYLFSVLRYLEHIGFGGDISTGKGHFEFKIEDFFLKEPKDAAAFVTLSLYSPTINEVSLFKKSRGKVFYEPVLRKGRLGRNISHDVMKNPVMMFTEGSLFPVVPGQNYHGQNITVRKPDGNLTHPVYHYGMAFDVKINA
ncbi:MAG: type III-A CRISPR-associated RAMP protein Csm4 [Chlorobi bacterium]|nr:type III-A CRISPR-associated RAMP protein Csm4 [Chlorobiota bacterium]